jgi:hypothetical protein
MFLPAYDVMREWLEADGDKSSPDGCPPSAQIAGACLRQQKKRARVLEFMAH